MNRIIGVLSLLLFLPGVLLAYDVEVIQDNGDPTNRYDIVVLGDGYRDVDQTKLTTDTNWFLSAFWQQTPYGNYRSYFNVKLVHVISNENGADNGSYGTTRDTALGAYFNCSGIDRLLCVNVSTVLSVASSHVPEYDTIFVIVNDPKYGGAGYSNGIAVFSVHSAAPEIAEHEFGHSFGGLADEYEDAYPGFPPCGSDCPEPNVTNHNTLPTIKWNLWIDGSTPIPTPETSAYANVVGLFEGARYQTTGVYRPRLNCKMRSLSVPFCQICAEAMVWSLYREVDPIDAVSPASPVAISGCDRVTLTVAHPSPNPDTMEVSWWLDSVPVANGTDDYQLTALQLSLGAHTVEVEVSDETTLVRSDPQSLLFSRRSWQVNVSGSAGGYCLIGVDCWPAGTVNPINPCQVCQPSTNPNAWTSDDSLPCDDGQWCNGTSSCSAGSCLPGTAPCQDDGIGCTQTCDEQSDTCNAISAGWCLIDGLCYTQGTADPQNSCRACNPAVSQTAWTDVNGLACDDGLFCNGADTCAGGSCGNHAGDPCAGGGECANVCSEEADTCRLAPGTTCADDGNGCTDDICDGQGNCVHVDNAVACDDGVFCNGADTCSGGSCTLHAGDPCAGGGECGGTCNEDGDNCGVVPGTPCTDDGNPCTDDACNGQGACAHTPNAAGCDDGLFCNGDDTCSEGSCSVHAGDPCAGGAECADACDEQRDSCLLPQGAACSEDGNPCTDDVCDGEGVCLHTNNQAPCEDGVFCNGQEMCRDGVCSPGESPCADDGLACTDDSCDESGGRCVNTPRAGWCVAAGACVQDGETLAEPPCRVCDSASQEGWAAAADGTACDDGDDCTEGDVCGGGSCLAGEQICSADCPCPGLHGGCGCSSSSGSAPWALLALVFILSSRIRSYRGWRR